MTTDEYDYVRRQIAAEILAISSYPHKKWNTIQHMIRKKYNIPMSDREIAEEHRWMRGKCGCDICHSYRSKTEGEK